MTAPPVAVEIQGRTLTFPIEVRDADSWAAQFLVPAQAAQAIIEPTGLEVAQPLPGKAMLNIAFVNYRDTDLDSYSEVAIAFLVRRDDARGGGDWITKMKEFLRGDIGVFIHQLPVNETFTLEAGQTIWGYPKFLAEIDIIDAAGTVTCTLNHDGAHVLTLRVRDGGYLPLPSQNLVTYSLRDDVLRRTPWEQDAKIEARLGGARVELGSHPIADELRTLGLPKGALMCSTMRGMHAGFGPAEPL